MRLAAGSFAALAVLVSAAQAEAASVTVTVTGVRDSRGVVRVAICPRGDFLHLHCPYYGHSPSKAGSVAVTINTVPPGVYAAEAYQDSNDNGLLDRNWLGLPLEGMGFSNDAPMNFGPPSFDDAALTVGGASIVISFRLRYFTGP